MAKRYLGIDLGGTNTKIGVATESGEILKSVSIPTEPNGGAHGWATRVIQAVDHWDMSFDAVGVGSPGPVDTKTGTILTSWNLRSFEGTPMIPLLAAAFRRPIYFENDANCGALAEYMFGHFKGTAHIVVLTLGTGVGSGVIVDHRLLRGTGGFAAEIGHMIIDRTLDDSTLQEYGCLEGHLGANKSIHKFRKLSKDCGPDLSMRDIFQRAEGGDPVAEKFVDGWIRDLAIGLANVALIFNPDVAILAGGITASWDIMKSKLNHLLNDYVPAPILKSFQVELSQLGEFFGVQGAIALAIQETSGESWSQQLTKRVKEPT